MKVLKFNLNGDFAFFKNESINDMYETYPHIHKPALLGLFGAILGYDGYAQTNQIFGKDKEENLFPEYYRKLKDLKVGIVPKKYCFSKSIQNYNNSTGMFNKGNLIVTEVWLEKPSWDIYLLLDNFESEKLKESIVNKKTVYSIYLGINNHFANIDEIEVLELNELLGENIIIDSLVKEKDIVEVKGNKIDVNATEIEFTLPYELSPETNIYLKERYKLSNVRVDLINTKAYKLKDKIVVFY